MLTPTRRLTSRGFLKLVSFDAKKQLDTFAITPRRTTSTWNTKSAN